MKESRRVKNKLVQDTGPYHSIAASFEAEFYDGELLDTYVELAIPRFGITWNDREKLIEEIAEVIRKYQI